MERTLLEAKMGDPLDGRVSLLHELVEADQEGLFFLPLLAGLRRVLGREKEAWMDPTDGQLNTGNHGHLKVPTIGYLGAPRLLSWVQL